MEKVIYRFVPTNFGTALIAGSEGVQFLHLGSNKKQLLQKLKEKFDTAALVENEKAFPSEVNRLLAYTNGDRRSLQIPLIIEGTEFQNQVWDYLKTIPSGTTKSYQEVATAIGRPKAVRAVASACAQNDIALAIPCHRVVRTDGSLSEYRWGRDRKAAFLALETQ